jgi:hypothetical protein
LNLSITLVPPPTFVTIISIACHGCRRARRKGCFLYADLDEGFFAEIEGKVLEGIDVANVFLVYGFWHMGDSTWRVMSIVEEEPHGERLVIGKWGRHVSIEIFLNR